MKIDTIIQSSDSALRKLWEQLARVINYHIGFGDGVNADNVDGVWVTAVTPGTPNTNFTVTHNLGRVPVGYIPMSKTAATDIYTGSVAATTTQLTLKATIAGVTVNLFII